MLGYGYGYIISNGSGSRTAMQMKSELIKLCPRRVQVCMLARSKIRVRCYQNIITFWGHY